MPRLTGRAGIAAIELVYGLALAAIVGAAAMSVLVRHQRAAFAISASASARSQLRQGIAALSAELLAAGGGAADLLARSDTAVELLVTVGIALSCADAASGTVLDVAPRARDGLLPAATWLRFPTPGDTVLVFDPARGEWSGHRVAASAPAPCADSLLASRRFAVRLILEPPGLSAPLTGRTVVRVARRARWSVYRAADRTWSLGEREETVGKWSATQPVAGPMVGVGAARPSPFRFLDARGAALDDLAPRDSVAAIAITLRARAAGAAVVDSVRAVIAIRPGP